MWRFFNSIPRGARSVRPSQCCSQDNVDEKNKWNPNSCSSPLPEAQCEAIIPRHTFKNPKNETSKYICPLVAITKNLGIKDFKGASSNPDFRNPCPRFKWVWANPCNVYPHCREEWKNRWEKERWKRFQRRHHHLLPPNSILNAVGWGSAAAFTWTLVKYLKSLSLAYKQNQNQKQIQSFNYTTGNRDKCNQSLGTNLESNEEYKHGNNEDYYQYDSYCLQISPAWWLSQNGHHHWKVDSQTGDGETSRREYVFNKNFTESNIVSPPSSNNEQPSQKENHKENEVSQELSTSVANVFDVYNEEKPQVETDREAMQKCWLTQQDDSGYCESNECKSDDSSRTLPDFSPCHCASEDNLAETSSFKAQESTSDALYEACPKSTLSTEDILVNETSIHVEQSAIKPDKTQNKFQYKDVLIEDCSCSEQSVPNVALSPGQAGKVFDDQTSPTKQTTHTASIDEFSDGLQEIIDAGQKDLNDFSTQFLGILEGDIGRSIATEEPDEAIHYFRAGALLGDASSTFNLALCYHMARGTEEDLKMARELYEAASLVGHSWAIYNLAVMLNEGQGGPVDLARAESLLAKAADMGVSEAQVALVQLEKSKEHTARNRDKDLQANYKPKHESSISSVQSEPSLTSALSNLWLSSYSTSDLDFLEDSLDQNVQDLSSLRMDVEKPRFYLG